MLEWECALKHPEQGAAEGAPFIESHIIRVTEHAFDDFAGGATDAKANKKALGLAELEIADHGTQRALARGASASGMVGGGQGAFIGAVHRIASRLDDQYELVAGALSSEPERARASGLELGLRDRPCLRQLRGDGAPEARRKDGIEVGRDRHAEPHAFPRRQGVPASAAST